jgi:hypothetical protein
LEETNHTTVLKEEAKEIIVLPLLFFCTSTFKANIPGMGEEGDEGE